MGIDMAIISYFCIAFNYGIGAYADVFSKLSIIGYNRGAVDVVHGLKRLEVFKEIQLRRADQVVGFEESQDFRNR